MAENFGSLLPQRGNAQRVLEAKILLTLNGGGSGASAAPNYTGTGSPEGVVTALQGSIYQEFDAGGTWIRQWIKQSGSGNTGWI